MARQLGAKGHKRLQARGGERLQQHGRARIGARPVQPLCLELCQNQLFDSVVSLRRLELDEQAGSPPQRVDRFAKRRNGGSAILRVEPGSGVEPLYFSEREILEGPPPDTGLPAPFRTAPVREHFLHIGRPLERIIVQEDDPAVLRQPEIELDERRPLVGGKQERRYGVLRCVGGSAAVCDEPACACRRLPLFWAALQEECAERTAQEGGRDDGEGEPHDRVYPISSRNAPPPARIRRTRVNPRTEWD